MSHAHNRLSHNRK